MTSAQSRHFQSVNCRRMMLCESVTRLLFYRLIIESENECGGGNELDIVNYGHKFLKPLLPEWTT